MYSKVTGRESIDPSNQLNSRCGVRNPHAAKKPKTTSMTGPPLYSELDLAQLTVDAKLQGSNETRFATVKYKDERMVFQMASVGEAMRVPCGIDDGSKFNSKPSMKLELSDEQLAFMRAVEDKVIDTAVKNKAEWFAGVKPLPSEAEVRKAFSSRVSVDPGTASTRRRCASTSNSPTTPRSSRCPPRAAWATARSRRRSAARPKTSSQATTCSSQTTGGI